MILLVLLAACGGQPEQVILPTEAALPTVTSEEETLSPEDTLVPTADPQVFVIPTPLPQRDIAPDIDAGLQVVAVSGTGSVGEGAETVAGDLYVSLASNGRLARMTLDPGTDNNPVWTPDGSRVFFDSDREGTPYIYIVNATNSNPIQRLSAFPAGDQREPTISPDGLSLAFTSNRGGADAIYRINAIDGRALVQLTFNATRDYEANWSPDNTWIVHTSERDGNPEIYLMDTNGGQVMRLTDHPGLDMQPSFSPDGRQIAFVSDRNGVPQVFVMGVPIVEADFNEPSENVSVTLVDGVLPPAAVDLAAPPPSVFPITSGPEPKSHPTWYLDETGQYRIAYVSLLNSETGQSQVYVASSDGSNPRSATDPFYSMTAPAVRPIFPEPDQ
jgi:Tol biopolymer transport system component